MGRDSAVSIATRYGLDGPGSNPGGGEISAPVQTGPGTHPANGSFPGVKWQGRGVNHSPPPSARVKERVEPYLNSTSVPSWQVIE